VILSFSLLIQPALMITDGILLVFPPLQVLPAPATAALAMGTNTEMEAEAMEMGTMTMEVPISLLQHMYKQLQPPPKYQIIALQPQPQSSQLAIRQRKPIQEVIRIQIGMEILLPPALMKMKMDMDFFSDCKWLFLLVFLFFGSLTGCDLGYQWESGFLIFAFIVLLALTLV
jgi:hypothetical protein